MKYLPQLSHSPVRILVIGCVHGDEGFGHSVFQRLCADSIRRPQVSLLLANEPAMEKNVRFIESDLNRSFPGNANGTHEERLAAEMLPILREATHVIDIHTTTSDIRFLPIVTNLGSSVRPLLRHASASEIAYIQPSFGTRSLIGQVEGGASLEFGRAYAETESAYQDILRVIDGLLKDTPATPVERRVFHVTGFIPDTVPLPSDVKDYQYIPALDCYPILLHEKAYVGSHAMKAASAERIML